jgi:hypothetical protein
MKIMDDASYRALIEEIYDAFRTVTREGGVSWSEAYVMDGYCPAEETVEARKGDTDKSWTELVDSDWWEHPGMGGWAFLDPIGSRYYLPAAMVRALRRGESELAFWLELVGTYDRDLWRARSALAFEFKLPGSSWSRFEASRWSLLDERQRNCVKSFITLMLHGAREREDHFDQADWQGVRASGWDEL